MKTRALSIHTSVWSEAGDASVNQTYLPLKLKERMPDGLRFRILMLPFQFDRFRTKRLVQSLFLVSDDGAVGRWVSNTGQHVASLNLVIIQEGLIRLIDGPSLNLTSTGRASTCTAGVGEVNALFFSRVKDVLIIGNFDGGIQPFRFID